MHIFISFGANIPGPWGTPYQTIQKALTIVQVNKLNVGSVSRCYLTAPAGPGNQGSYLNGVLSAECTKPPKSLLAMLKQMERAAGRRGYGIPNGPRSLDLDILDYGGLILKDRNLSLPHPRLHLRPFVLRPLAEVAPHWIHPTLKITTTQLWQGNYANREGRILNELERQEGPEVSLK